MKSWKVFGNMKKLPRMNEKEYLVRIPEDTVPGLGAKPQEVAESASGPEVWTLPDGPSPASSRSSLLRSGWEMNAI